MMDTSEYANGLQGLPQSHICESLAVFCHYHWILTVTQYPMQLIFG
jgi:hypothetical protein